MYEGNKIERSIIIFLFIVSLLSIVSTIILLVTPKFEGSIILGVDELNSGIKKSNAILMDLRDEQDYEAGHIDGAINMPYTDGGVKMLDYLKKNANKNSVVYLMCYYGTRSGMAFNLLRDEGYKRLNYVKFGYEEYVNTMGSKFKPTVGECPCKKYN